MKICEETVREAIDTNLADIRLSEQQKQAILARCREQTVKMHRPIQRMPRRMLAVAAVFLTAVCLCGGVLAAAPELRQSLVILGNEALQQLQPINQVSEDQGIRMEVLAGIDDGNAAAVFISLQDTTGQGRIGPTSQLYTAEISGRGFTSGEVVHYDADTQTVILRLTANGQMDLTDKKITVTTYSVLSGEHMLEPTDVGYSVQQLRKLCKDTKTQLPDEVESFTVSGPNQEETIDRVESNQLKTLVPWEKPVKFEQAPWGNLAAAGVVDGEVHLLIAADKELGAENRLSFDLVDQQGQLVDCTKLDLEVGEPYRQGSYVRGNSLIEYVLIPPEGVELDSLHLAVSGVFYDSLLRGNWSTTFKLEKASKRLEYLKKKDMGGWKAEKVYVSPIAVTVEGTEFDSSIGYDTYVEVWMKDGTQLECDTSSVEVSENNKVRYQQIFNQIIDPEQVEKVLLNGDPVF